MEGYDIQTDIASAHKMLGLCPQHNILFDQLTAKHYLYLEPSGGTASVNGYDIQIDITNVWKTLQLRSQHSIFFDH